MFDLTQMLIQLSAQIGQPLIIGGLQQQILKGAVGA
jgi:hypothetical protein